jgi:GMP synthase-like glutamine amidotransferase
VTSYETAQGELPALDAYDAFILSGSRHGAYEQLPWIVSLLAWTRDAVQARQRLLGVCFGHQVCSRGGTALACVHLDVRVRIRCLPDAP